MSKSEKPKNSPGPRAGKAGRNKGISHAEIARAAGVSPGLVSAFFSGNHYGPDRKSGIGISLATRRKIKETCHRLRYVPDNPLGYYRLYPEKADVAFMLNTTVTDGVANPYHAMVFDGFAKCAFKHDVDLSNLFFLPDHDYLIVPEELPNAIQRGAIKKVAITGNPVNYSLINCLLRMEVEVVAAGQAPPVDGVVSVVPDFKKAAYLGLKTIFEHGHRRIAVISYDRTLAGANYNSRLFREGCLEAIADFGIELCEGDFIVLKSTPECTFWADRWKDPRLRPTALFSLEDQLARELAQCLRINGMRIPEDISVVGCNDDLINRNSEHGFSTVALPCYEIGARAFSELNRVAVEGRPEGPETIILPPNYVDRGTVLPAR